MAENSGGPHTLKYGTTTNHVLALQLVLPDGDRVELGSASGWSEGYDLVGAVVGVMVVEFVGACHFWDEVSDFPRLERVGDVMYPQSRVEVRAEDQLV